MVLTFSPSVRFFRAPQPPNIVTGTLTQLTVACCPDALTLVQREFFHFCQGCYNILDHPAVELGVNYSQTPTY